MKITANTERAGEELQGEIVATHKREQVGLLRFTDYAEYGGGRRVQIELVQVSADHQREGVATAMVAELRKQVPTSRLARPNLNPAGRALLDAIFDRFSAPLS